MKFLIALTIVVIPFIFFNPVTAQPKLPENSQLVDAGGHLLHLNIQGKGNISVILENGSGDFSFIWSLVQAEVAKVSRVVSYDRAGYAWSEVGPTPRTDKQIAFELHTALHNAGVLPPFVLVGQSFGGFLVRAFARYYPSEVKGIVLVDAVQEDGRIIIGGNPTRIRDFAKGLSAPETVKNFSVKKDEQSNPTAVLDSTIEFPLTILPKRIQQLQIWAQSQPAYRAASESEMTWSPEDVARLYANRGKPDYMLGAMPLIVLTRGKGGYDGRSDSLELEKIRLASQQELAKLSTNSKHIIDQHSGHNIHLEDPKVVINAIKEVVEAVRKKKQL